jgi:3-phosphoshikimate 1-carboxyvinyltransferase
MDRALLERWDAHVNVHASASALLVSPASKLSIEQLLWRLPASKSHAIRWLALAAQSEQEVVIHNLGHAGQDILSMRRCLTQLGVRITDLNHRGEALVSGDHSSGPPPQGTVSWCVEGVGVSGLKSPNSVLNAGNSGTALRILMALCARLKDPVILDGDASLRSRNHDVMTGALEHLGVKISRYQVGENLPLRSEGPWTPVGSIPLDISTSSQPTTALCLAAPALPSSIKLESLGTGVSLRHSELTKVLCEQTGASPSIHQGELSPWTPNIKGSSVVLPPDASMLSFAFLAAKVAASMVHIEDVPETRDALGHEVLFEFAPFFGLQLKSSILSNVSDGRYTTIDLRHGNDLITPVAALLALAKGGEIIGAQHAAYKETDRTLGTVALLKQFGLEASFDDGRLVVPGGQRLRTPEGLVETYGDHRMQMTALVLAMGCGRDVLVEGADLHEVADPEAVQRWQAAGVSIEPLFGSIQ